MSEDDIFAVQNSVNDKIGYCCVKGVKHGFHVL
jgi:hypothetical protein